MKKIVISLCVALFATTIISCANKSDNNASVTQNNGESSEPVKVVREEPKSNSIDKFVGTYSVEGDSEYRVEVLSDGRVLACSNRRSDDKSYMGDVKVISDYAFTISPSEGSLYYSGNTPEYRIIDGVEKVVTWHSEGAGSIAARYLVFDIQEKRIYTKGYSKYRNRDIEKTEYMKMIH